MLWRAQDPIAYQQNEQAWNQQKYADSCGIQHWMGPAKAQEESTVIQPTMAKWNAAAMRRADSSTNNY